MHPIIKPIVLGLFISVFASCREKADQSKAQKIKSFKNVKGIEVEEFDSTNTDDSRYNYDNALFTEGKTFRYELIHHTKNGDSISFEVPPQEQMYQAPWNYVEPDNPKCNKVCRNISNERTWVYGKK